MAVDWGECFFNYVILEGHILWVLKDWYCEGLWSAYTVV